MVDNVSVRSPINFLLVLLCASLVGLLVLCRSVDSYSFIAHVDTTVHDGQTFSVFEAGPFPLVNCALSSTALVKHLDSAVQARTSNSERGLLFMALFGSAASRISPPLDHFAKSGYDLVIVALDDYDWSTFRWAQRMNTKIIKDKGFKYVLASRHLEPLKLKKMGISHVFIFDDDIEFHPEFDAAQLLALLQSTPAIAVAAPFVNDNCHLLCADEFKKASLSRQLHSAHALRVTPEMMFPIYSVAAWACYRERIVIPLSHLPEMWGIDTVAAGCICADAGASILAGQFVILGPTFSVNHTNKKTLSGGSSFSSDRASLSWNSIIDLLKIGPEEVWGDCYTAGYKLRNDNENPALARGICFEPTNAKQKY